MWWGNLKFIVIIVVFVDYGIMCGGEWLKFLELFLIYLKSYEEYIN